MKSINLVLIGCGYWGTRLRRYIEGDGSFSLVKVCNSKTNLDEVWQDESLPAVVVATPMATHFRIVKAALLAGKSVLCAKPLALRTAECKELKKIAEERDRPLLVDFTYTFSRALAMAQMLLKARNLGKVLGFSLTARQWGRFGRENVLWLLASHLLSILDMFLPIADLSFSKTELVFRGNTLETAVLFFEGLEQVGLINVSINYLGKEVSVAVYGEEGTIVYNPLLSPSLRLERYDGRHEQFYIDEANNLGLLIKEFARMLNGKQGGNVARAVAVTRVIEGLGLDKKHKLVIR